MPRIKNISAECGLGTEDFRIDSSDWNTVMLDDETVVKMNPEGDVTELLDGPFAGCQHFTQAAALRETAKAGKRIPTKDEWIAAIRFADPCVAASSDWQNSPGIAAKLGLKLDGFRDHFSAGCYDQGVAGYYWSSSTEGVRGHFTYFSASEVVLEVLEDWTNGLSVRCLKG